MSANFVSGLQRGGTMIQTENGANALSTTGNYVLDFYGQAGAIRDRSENDIVRAFSMAWSENPLLALKCLFYARDIRGGLGERKVFRTILKYLGNNNPEAVIKNMTLIPEYGRWDDLFVLIGTKVEKEMMQLVGYQLVDDIKNLQNGEKFSLLGKWMKSNNTSSRESREIAYKFQIFFKQTPKEYRRTLAMLRTGLDVLERKMSSNEWRSIVYSGVSSNAMTKYRKAFSRHDPDGFVAYLNKVEKGEVKINSTTLYPYDILRTIYSGGYNTNWKSDRVSEAQWKALPNYIEGENSVLIMADSSGSMYGHGGLPIMTSLGLAVYFAERNQGVWHNKFLTFSSTPHFVEIKGDTLQSKLNCIPEIVQNTNLKAAFDLILQTAISNNLTNDDLPKAIIIISDMQFDGCTGGWNKTLFETMTAKFSAHGYTMPNVIFWNVRDSKNSFQVDKESRGVQLASGHSVSVFKSVLEGIGYNPVDAMLKVLEGERYSKIVL